VSRKLSLNPQDVALAAGVGLAGALGFGVLLTALAKPADFDARTAALSDRAARAEALLKPLRDRGPYAANVLCTSDPAAEAEALRDRVSEQAIQAGLAVDSLETRVEPAPDLSERVTPVRVRLSATGSYEAAVGLLALLGRERAQVFVDSLDLTPKVSNVTLSISGRVFCGA